MSLLSRSKTQTLPSLPENSASYAPFLIGIAMVGFGLALRRTEPNTLSLPEPNRPARLKDVKSGRDAARVARDGIARFIPANLTGSLGRTLILMGGATIAVRALDELVDDEGPDY
ncbi:hypothetical protein SAMN05421853_101184 [Roseivivax halotolerans]|jgi:hypothetical protein|uniref:Uncharacterized protein n=1 Tax=Roseivivax halotolerans TaxID=93684 RepID=A0A1I5UVA4_9RHOB|nr:MULTISPECIES: hypothetical protein [Roseivivax]QFT64680.1 hypothetical protein FIU91_17210 [Roseivivax sp. THAF30]SFP99118.1 hypothetical protein SAMN05421853_101184 [Roseivivax halotolerans]